MILRLTLPAFFLVTFFQNCAVPMNSKSDFSDGPGGQKIIGPASEFDRVAFQVNPADHVNTQTLHLDVAAGSATLKQSGLDVKDCAVSDVALEELRTILNSANICEPGPLPPNTAVCMIYSFPDIMLSSSANGASSIDLRPVICHSGTYLCDGLDKPFRDALRALAESCQ